MTPGMPLLVCAGLLISGVGLAGAKGPAQGELEVGSCQPNAKDAGYALSFYLDQSGKPFMRVRSISGWAMDDRWETRSFALSAQSERRPDGDCAVVFKGPDQPLATPKGQRLQNIQLDLVFEIAKVTGDQFAPKSAALSLKREGIPLNSRLGSEKCSLDPKLVRAYLVECGS